MEINAIVAGAGIWGCTVARRLAEAGRRVLVLVLEKRPVVGGNVRCETDEETDMWAQIKMHRQFMSRHSPNPAAKLPPEQKRWDELMAKSFAGTITKPEVDELMALGAMSPKPASTPVDETQSGPMGELDSPINLGEWAKKVINSVDAKKRVIVFKGGLGKDGASHSIPKTSNAAWMILRLLLESGDPDGWTVLPENLRKTWKQHFYRVNKNPDLSALRRHIYSNNKPGQRGIPKIRLERRERKTRRK